MITVDELIEKLEKLKEMDFISGDTILLQVGSGENKTQVLDNVIAPKVIVSKDVLKERAAAGFSFLGFLHGKDFILRDCGIGLPGTGKHYMTDEDREQLEADGNTTVLSP